MRGWTRLITASHESHIYLLFQFGSYRETDFKSSRRKWSTANREHRDAATPCVQLFLCPALSQILSDNKKKHLLTSHNIYNDCIISQTKHRFHQLHGLMFKSIVACHWSFFNQSERGFRCPCRCSSCPERHRQWWGRCAGPEPRSRCCECLWAGRCSECTGCSTLRMVAWSS